MKTAEIRKINRLRMGLIAWNNFGKLTPEILNSYAQTALEIMKKCRKRNDTVDNVETRKLYSLMSLLAKQFPSKTEV